MHKTNAPVVFDLDGTITKKDTYIPFLASCMKTFGVRKWSILLLPIYTTIFKLGFITNSRLKAEFLKAILGGVTHDEVKAVAKQFVRQLFEGRINNEILELLHDYRRKGHRLILASASFDFYVETIADMLRTDSFVCTKAEIRDHYFTGRIDGKNCYGEEKVRQVLNLIGPREMQNIIVYTDHYSDLPLVRESRTAYMVNPNNKTRRYLEKRGYQLVGVKGASTDSILEVR